MSTLAEIISLGCRLFLAALFLWASHDKVWWPASFAQDMAAYDILPMVLVNSASVVMAWLEMLVGLFLLVGFWTRAAALWSAAMLAFFIGLMVWAGFTGAGFDCGCFPGDAGHPAGFDAALRDFYYLLPALWLLIWPGRWLSLWPPARRRRYEGLLLD